MAENKAGDQGWYLYTLNIQMKYQKHSFQKDIEEIWLQYPITLKTNAVA